MQLHRCCPFDNSQPHQSVFQAPGRHWSRSNSGRNLRNVAARGFTATAASRTNNSGRQTGPNNNTSTSYHHLPLGAAAVAALLYAAAAANAVAMQADAAASLAATAVAAATAAAAGADYMPDPVEVGWEIWAGFIAGIIPFAIASVEFGKRILIQRHCPSCRGRGLVRRGRLLRKCSDCGGLLPWMGWRYFLLGTADPGNGGFLLQPQGQTSVFYSVPSPLGKQQPQGQAEAQQDGQQQKGQQEGQPDATPAAAAEQQQQR